MIYTLGIDIGTTNVKSVLFGEKIKAIAESAYEYPTIFPRSSWAQQNPESWWDGVIYTINDVLSQSRVDAENIKAVAVSCQSPCALIVDRDGKPLHDALIWMDRRSTEELRMLEQAIGAEKIFEITGNRLDTYYMLTKLMWLSRNHPELVGKTYKVLQANGYVNLRLTGAYTIDYSNVSLTQLYDLKNKCWSKVIFDYLGLDESIMPDIYACSDVIGSVSAAASKITGLKAGTPVLAGAVDASVAALEAGLHRGEALEMSGTSSVLMIRLNKLANSTTLSHVNGVNEQTHLLYGAMSTTGGALRWFRDNLYAGKTKQKDSYKRMDDEVLRKSPDPSKLIFLPYMVGERAPIWNPNASGMFFGLNMTTSRAQMIRALMEGAAFALRDNLDEAEKIVAHVNLLYMVGGCCNSDIWLKIKASVLDREIIVPSNTLGAPGGLACLMSTYTKEFSTAEYAAVNCFKIAKTIEPVNSWVPVYNELYALFKNIYISVKNDFDILSQIH